METVGQRINRLRIAKGLSRPALGRKMAEAIGRKMAEAIGRKEAFTGETVRLYEGDKNVPGKDARTALAKVFGKPEPYILYGDAQPHAAEAAATYSVRDSEGKKRELGPREDLLLDLFAGLFSLQQRALIDEVRALFEANQVTRRELHLKPLRGVSDATVAAAFGAAPHTTGKAKPHPAKKKASAEGARPPGTELDDTD